MGAADLLRAGQRLLAGQFPATVTIAGQCYQVASSGLRRETSYADGPGEISRRVSFWLPVQAFADAGQPLPRELSPLFCEGVEYQIEVITTDPERVNVTLACVQHPQ